MLKEIRACGGDKAAWRNVSAFDSFPPLRRRRSLWLSKDLVLPEDRLWWLRRIRWGFFPRRRLNILNVLLPPSRVVVHTCSAAYVAHLNFVRWFYSGFKFHHCGHMRRDLIFFCCMYTTTMIKSTPFWHSRARFLHISPQSSAEGDARCILPASYLGIISFSIKSFKDEGAEFQLQCRWIT